MFCRRNVIWTGNVLVPVGNSGGSLMSAATILWCFVSGMSVVIKRHESNPLVNAAWNALQLQCKYTSHVSDEVTEFKHNYFFSQLYNFFFQVFNITPQLKIKQRSMDTKRKTLNTSWLLYTLQKKNCVKALTFFIFHKRQIHKLKPTHHMWEIHNLP